MVLVGWQHHLLLRQRLILVPSALHGTAFFFYLASILHSTAFFPVGLCLSWYWWVGGITCCYDKRLILVPSTRMGAARARRGGTNCYASLLLDLCGKES
jgi:hypothetical protein